MTPLLTPEQIAEHYYRFPCDQQLLIDRIKAVIICERERCAKLVRIHQDIVSWQPGESRNALLQEIEDDIRNSEAI